MNNYKKLKVWNQSIELNLAIYKLYSQLPKSDYFELQNQSKRAAISIASNIAEGSGRGSEKDFCRFLYISMGSASELECQLLILQKLSNTDVEPIISEIVSIQKQLHALIKSLSSRFQL